jgi:hypothetical protein
MYNSGLMEGLLQETVVGLRWKFSDFSATFSRAILLVPNSTDHVIFPFVFRAIL